jgi:hypothetical protein
MFAAMGLAAALVGAEAVWPVQPVAQSPRPTEAPANTRPPGVALDGPTNQGEGPWTKYQVPPLPPGFTLDPPQSPPEPWLNDPIVGSPEDPYAGFSRVAPPPPPGFRPVSELSDAELLAALYRLPAGWEHAEPNGWLWKGFNEETLLLTQSARQANHIWVRYEYKSQREGLRSTRALIEADCTGWRTRQAQFTSFSRANLQGLVDSNDWVLPWSAAAPGTFGETILKAACGE